MHVIPWDPKALKQEVARIVRSFSGKDEAIHHQRGEKMVPTMHVTPWDRKALRTVYPKSIVEKELLKWKS